MNELLTKIASSGLTVAIILVLIDFALAVLVALKKNQFEFEKLPDFLATGVLPYLGGLVVLSFGKRFIPAFEVVYVGAVAAIMASYISSAVTKARELFGVNGASVLPKR